MEASSLTKFEINFRYDYRCGAYRCEKVASFLQFYTTDNGANVITLARCVEHRSPPVELMTLSETGYPEPIVEALK